MINFLRIKNFKVHEDIKLKFTEGLNVITGSSDVGKSTVFKALMWLLTNRPTGNSYLRWGSEGPVSVTAGVDGLNIKHLKKGTSNSYSIIRSKTDKTTFKAIGTKVPPEVTVLMNLGEYNTQSQFKPHFLLSESSGEVARKLNELMGIDIIDEYIRRANKIVRDTTQEETALKDSEARLKGEIKKYNWVPSAKKRLKKIKSLEEERKEKNRKFESLGLLLMNLDKMNKLLGPIEKVIQYKSTVEKLEAKSEDIVNITTKLIQLEDVKARYEDLLKKRKMLKKYVGMSDRIEYLTESSETLTIRLRETNNLKRLLGRIKNYRAYQDKVKAELKALEDEKAEILGSMEICPTCGREL